MGRTERRRTERRQRRHAASEARARRPRPAGRPVAHDPFLHAIANLPPEGPAEPDDANDSGTVGATATAAPTSEATTPTAAATRARSDRAGPAMAAPSTRATALHVTNVGCGAVADTEPPALGVSYEFDARRAGEPYPVTVRFVGRRSAAPEPPGPRDAFDVVERVDGVVPGTGRITFSTRVEGIAAGVWTVAAGPVGEQDGTAAPPVVPSGRTGWAPAVRSMAPGVRIGAWPGMVGLGAIVAVTVQAVLVARLGMPVLPVLGLSALACLAGILGAKLYYLAEHPRRPRDLVAVSTGMCIQGFVLAAVGTVVVGALLLGLPVLSLLDATAPALLPTP